MGRTEFADLKRLRASLGWYGRTFNESEMARSSECTERYAQKVLDRDPHCQRGLITPVDYLWSSTARRPPSRSASSTSHVGLGIFARRSPCHDGFIRDRSSRRLL